MPDQYTYKYDAPSKILAVWETMRQTELIRAESRAKVDRMMNGECPWTPEQVKKLQMQFAVNWGEGQNLIMRANTQINGALLHKGNFFTAKALKGPVEKRDEWSQVFTEAIQEPMKRGKSGKRHLFLMKDRNASLTMHGIGPMMWMNDSDWMPKFIALEDLLIPTDTKLDFSNLSHFAVNLYLTPYELFDLAFKEDGHKGWNQDAIKKILNCYKSINVNPFNYDWYGQPERMQEIWKQNRVWADNDSVPVVRLVAFYYRGTESTNRDEKWYRKIVLREVVASANSDAMAPLPDEFIFEWDKPFATDIDHILHVQYGDCSLVPPLRHHSVRGLGPALYAVIECMNRLRCQFAQHVFESFLMYFRVTNPAMQDRPKQMQMFPFGVIPDGISIVPNNERHQIDPRLVDKLMAENRQLMSENSSSFVQDIDRGNQGNPITATEANIRLQSVNVIVSSMLNMMYTQENFYYEEVVRRFLNPTSEEPEVVKFRKRCKEAEIPDELMHPDCWLIDAERVFGGGDQTLAEQEVTKIMAIKDQLDPTPQRMALRSYISVIARDPAKGRQYVPENPAKVTDGMREAETAFGCLMADALPRSMPEGIEREDYIDTLLQMSEAKMQGIAQTDNVGSPMELKGLEAVLNHTAQNIEILEMDQNKKDLVKQFSDRLGQLSNELKGFSQRLAQKMEAEAQPQPDPEQQAKAMATQQKAEQDLQIKEAKAMQSYQQKQASFEQKMNQDAERHRQDLTQQWENHRQAMIDQFTQMKADLLTQKTQTASDIANQEKVAKATATASSKAPKES